MIPSSTTSRPAGLAAWLRVLVVALLMALAVPAIAMADEGAVGAAATAEQPTATEQPAATDGTAGQPGPADQASPAAEVPAPVTTEPAPAAPPAAEEPAPAPQAPPAAEEPAPTTPPASSGGGHVVDNPLPVIDLPEIQLPAPTIPEVLPGEPPLPGAGAAPTPGVGELVPVLTAPEAPRPPTIGTIAPALPPKAVTPVAVAVATVSAQAADGVMPLDLGGPPSLSGADPVSTASRAAVDGTEALAAVSVSLHGSLITLDPSHRPDPSGPVADVGVATPATTGFGTDDPTAQIVAPRLVSPVGPAPAQSLLAVLASYILPGSGPVPAGTIFLLVMLGVVLLAACAPRLGGSERIWLSGLVGPGSGHGRAVRRPG